MATQQQIDLRKKLLNKAIKPTQNPNQQKKNTVRFNTLQQLNAAVPTAPTMPTVIKPGVNPTFDGKQPPPIDDGKITKTGTTDTIDSITGGNAPGEVTPNISAVEPVLTQENYIKKGFFYNKTGNFYTDRNGTKIDPMTGAKFVDPAEEELASYGEIGEANIQAEFDANLEAELKLTGEQSGFASLEEFTNAQFDSLEESSDLKREQNDLSRVQTEEAVSAERNAAEGQVEAASGLMGSREGVTSTSNISAHSRAKEAMTTRLSRLFRDRDLSMKAFDQMEKDLDRAEREGNTLLADQYRSKLLAAESAAMDSETAYVNALTMASEEERSNQIQKNANLNSFVSIVGEGTELSVETIAGFASQLGLNFEDAYGYYAGAQAIRDDKTLTIEERKVKIDQATQDLEDQITGMDTQAAKNTKAYITLVQSGADAETIAAFKSAAGITDYNDPFTQAELKYKNAQIAYQASQTASNYQGMLTAQAEYDELYGSETFMPIDGKFTVTTASDGSISVGVVDGQVLDNPDTLRREDWCAAFANDALGTAFGDTFENKMTLVNASVPAPGMAFVQATAEVWGHVGIVESVNLSTGEMTVVESNWQKGTDEKGIVSRRTMKISDAAGFVKSEGSYSTSGSEPYSYNSYYSDAISQGLSTEAAEKFAVAQYTALNAPMTEVQTKIFDAYASGKQEEDTYKNILLSVTVEELAEGTNAITKQIKGDETLTADIINSLGVSEEVQRALNSELAWAESILRKKSGAAITASEYATYGRMYFPRVGDTAQTLADKQVRREVQITSLYGQMSDNGKKAYGELFSSSEPEEDPDELEYNSLAIVNDIDYQDAQSYYGTSTTTSPVKGFSSGIGSASPFKQ